MPQDHSRNENTRPDRARSERAAAAAVAAPVMSEYADRSVNAGLRMQNEMADVLQELGREWLGRTTSKIELTLKLPAQLTGARNYADALSVYQEWLSDWMSLVNEDTRRLLDDGRRIADIGARCMTGAPPATTT